LKICLRSKYSIDPCSNDDHLVMFRGAGRSHDKREKEGTVCGTMRRSFAWLEAGESYYARMWLLFSFANQ
jgi:hypothetical protein